MKYNSITISKGKESGILYKKDLYLHNTNKTVFLEGELIKINVDEGPIEFQIDMGLFGIRNVITPHFYIKAPLEVGTKIFVRYSDWVSKKNLVFKTDIFFKPQYKISYNRLKGIPHLLRKRKAGIDFGCLRVSSTGVLLYASGIVQSRIVIGFTRIPHVNKNKMPYLGSYYFVPIGGHQRSYRRKRIYNKVFYFRGYLTTRSRAYKYINFLAREVLYVSKSANLSLLGNSDYLVSILYKLYVKKMIYLFICTYLKSPRRDDIAFVDMFSNFFLISRSFHESMNRSSLSFFFSSDRKYFFNHTYERVSLLDVGGCFYLMYLSIVVRNIKLFLNFEVNSSIADVISGGNRNIIWTGSFQYHKNIFYTRNLRIKKQYKRYNKNRRILLCTAGFRFRKSRKFLGVSNRHKKVNLGIFKKKGSYKVSKRGLFKNFNGRQK